MDHPLILAYILIVVGLLLMVAEMFIPSGGILFVLSIGAIAVGVGLTFIYGQTSYGIPTLIGVFIVLPIVVSFGLHYWPRTPMGRRMFQTGPEADDTVASMPVNLELEQLRGQVGRAVSPLRPAGLVDFGGRRIDVMTEGMLVEADEWVRCIDVRAGKVVVRAIPKPRLGDLESADFS